MNQITWRYYKAHVGKFMYMSLWLIVAIVMDLVAPIVTKYIAEATSVNTGMIVVAFGILLVATISQAITSNRHSEFMWDFINEGRMELYELLAFDLRNFPSTNDLISFVQQDAFNILYIRCNMIESIVHVLLDLIFGIALIWYFINVGAVIIITVISLVIVGFYVIPTIWASRYDKKADEEVAEYRKICAGFAVLLRDYRLNSSQPYILTKIRKQMMVMSKAYLKSEYAQNWVNALGFGLRTTAIIFIVLLGQWITIWIKMSTTELLVMTQYLFYILMPLYNCMKLYKEKVRLGNVENRVRSIIDFNYNEDEIEKDKLDLERVKTLEFDNFKYTVNTEAGIIDVLSGINLTIQSGQMVGVVGKTGSGKSSLVKALYRVFDPTSGDLLINGKSARRYKRRSLYRVFFIVEQEAKIIEGTIADNLRSAKPHATDSEMREALVFAELDYLNLSEVIELPGSRQLSGGEKQRIAFAKLYLRRHEVSVIVLDEATSALDEDVQYKLLRKIVHSNFMNGKIAISVAHRLTTIENSDVIIVVENGQITECGNHDQLMDIEGGYYRLLVNSAERFRKEKQK